MSKPQFTVQATETSSNRGLFVIEPLPQGFGHTLGNSLRRVLYSSIPGAAITSVKIEGASHQFDTIDGVKEDVVQLILNLKLVKVAYSGSSPVKLTLSAKGPGVVTAGQFESEGNTKVMNPDLVIANLSDKTSRLNIEATVESGLGYSPAEDHKSSTVGLIPVDALYSPVVRVNYTVDATRVGRVTNFDRLNLEVITDGTVTPESALKTSAETLVEYFEALVNPEVKAPTKPGASAAAPSGSSLSIEELDLPTRIANALQKAGVNTVADLLSTPKEELAKIKNVGGKSVKVVELALKERGFELAL